MRERMGGCVGCRGSVFGWGSSLPGRRRKTCSSAALLEAKALVLGIPLHEPAWMTHKHKGCVATDPRQVVSQGQRHNSSQPSSPQWSSEQRPAQRPQRSWQPPLLGAALTA
jgi:hypothetical protein